jgi:hypothetical protein
MGYSKIFNCDKSLLPSIAHYFIQIPDEILSGKLHCWPMRHPGGIYNIAYHELSVCLSDALGKLEQLLCGDEDKWDALLLSQKYVYHEICSFYDECYMILKTFCPPSTVNPLFAYDWLNQNGYSSGGDFKSSTNHIIEPYQKINNKLKHNNQRLTGLSIKGKSTKVFIPGYIVEGVDAAGAIGPDLEVHTSKNGIGYSFALALQNVYFTVNLLSDKLLDVIKKDLETRFSFTFTSPPEYQKHNHITEDIFTRLCTLQSTYFPHEYSGQMPVFERDNNLFKILYPKRLKCKLHEDLSFGVQYTGDGYSRSFRIA